MVGVGAEGQGVQGPRNEQCKWIRDNPDGTADCREFQLLCEQAVGGALFVGGAWIPS